MKLFAFVMAIMVLVQSVMPCTDAGSANPSAKHNFVTVKSSHSHNSLKDDNCSPFCQCACCAGFSVDHTIASVPFIPAQRNNHKSSFLPSDAISVALPIWQPPQLIS